MKEDFLPTDPATDTTNEVGAADKPLTEPANKPLTEPANKPLTEPANKPLTEPANKPLTEAADKPLAKFVDRDVSWLEFNRRVLHEAVDDRTPLLERLMFLSIFTTNLDEFFMKRVGPLLRRLSEKESFRGDSEPLGQRLKEIYHTVVPMLDLRASCLREDILPKLKSHGIHLLGWNDLSDEDRQQASTHFRNSVFPVLTPQSVDHSHPFPFMSNLSVSLAVGLRNPETDEKLFARVKVPKLLAQWIELGPKSGSGQRRFVSLRDIIYHNLYQLFPGMIVVSVMTLRVTRSAEIDYEDDDIQDLLEMVTEEVRQRRLQRVVRLEHSPGSDRWLLDTVVEQLDLTPNQVFEMPDDDDYVDFKQIAGLDVPELRYPTWTPTIPPAMADDASDIFALIRSGDIMVHHPFESFDASVARFVRAAVNDDNVLAIKMTVYRTSEDSPFMPLLIQAAERGKQVACLVELKARFDEHRNIRWANALEDAGVHVVYGVIGAKTHTKTTIVVRREPDGLRSYAHIGSGNYNQQTAKVYTDLGLFTCRPEITGDVVELFHSLTGRSVKQDYERLLVAPVNMKERFLTLIEGEQRAHEAGRPAHIVGKMNQIQDPDICHALYRASQAGVPIDLIIRGFTVLRPGVPEFSPTIKVVSVIGRFLEHSRIFYFRNGADDPIEGLFYMGSADWMVRNLEARVEAVTPIDTRAFRERLWEILQIMLADRRQAWDMQPDGSYIQRMPTDDPDNPANLGTHQLLMDRTKHRNEPAQI